MSTPPNSELRGFYNAALNFSPNDCGNRYCVSANAKGVITLNPKINEEDISTSSLMMRRGSKVRSRGVRFGLTCRKEGFVEDGVSYYWDEVSRKSSVLEEEGSPSLKNPLSKDNLALSRTSDECVPSSFVQFRKREAINPEITNSIGQSAREVCFVFFVSVEKFAKAPKRNSEYFKVEGNAMERDIDDFERLNLDELKALNLSWLVIPCKHSYDAGSSLEKVK